MEAAGLTPAANVHRMGESLANMRSSVTAAQPHRPWARAVVTAFVAIQLIVPAAMLGARWINEGPMPESEYPFSWQMYSAVESGHYTGTSTDGTARELSLDGLPIVKRAISYNDDVPRLLCDQNPDLQAVARVDVEQPLSDHEREYQC